MDDREGSPERIADLLQQEDYMFDEEAPTPTAEQAENQSAQRQAAFGQAAAATNGPVKQGSGASKRIPIPAPPPKPTTLASTAAPSPATNGAVTMGAGPKRYFIIKSNSAYNIDLSVDNGVWATQVGAALHCLSRVYVC